MSRYREQYGSRIGKVCVVAAMLGVLGILPSDSQAVARAEGLFTQVVRAEIQGFVFYTDGKTPAAKVPIRVWDVAKRKFIFETETNEYGFYRLPNTDPGEYYLTFDWTRLKVVVVENARNEVQQPHHVVVVIPRDVGFIATPQMSAILLATTLSEMARQYFEEERPPVVSP